MFHGNSFFSFGSILVIVMAAMLFLSSMQTKLTAQIQRWQKEDMVLTAKMAEESR